MVGMGETKDTPAVPTDQAKHEQSNLNDNTANAAISEGAKEGLNTTAEVPRQDDQTADAAQPRTAEQETIDLTGPTDAEIIAQENLIRSELAEKRPLVGNVEPLSELELEYAEGSPVFRQKIRSLGKNYSSIRRIRGDGNCFIRGFLFGLLESITSKNDLQERNRLVTCFRQWVPKLKEGGFAEIVFEDALDMLIDQLNSLGQADSLTVETLESNMRDDTVSNMTVMFIRFLISCEIQRRQDFFAPFVMGMVDEDLDVKQFCNRQVEVMGTESDHVHIVALTDALQVPVRVLYLDRSMGAMMAGVEEADEADVNHHDFVPEQLQAKDPQTKPRVTVLYRPGHYDIIYPHSS